MFVGGATPHQHHTPLPSGSSQMKRFLLPALLALTSFSGVSANAEYGSPNFYKVWTSVCGDKGTPSEDKCVFVKPIAPYRTGNIIDFEMDYVGTTPSRKIEANCSNYTARRTESHYFEWENTPKGTLGHAMIRTICNNIR